MEFLEKWFKRDAVFRGMPGKPFDQSLSCGFINKSGYIEDITEEQYDRFAMIYVLRGSGRYRDSTGLQLALNAGDIFFRCPDRIHSTSIDPESQWIECFVSVRSEWYTLLSQIGLMHPEKVRFAIGYRPEIPERVQALVQQLRESDTPISNNNVEFEFVALIRRILTRNLENQPGDSRAREQLETARELVRTRATESVNMSEILQPIALSYSRLRSLFNQVYGTSPGEYRIQVRIDEACALLENTDMTVQEISLRLGYADAFTFSRQFKQRIGTAPQHFRRQPGRRKG